MLVEKLFVLGPPIGAVELYGDDRRLELSERDNPFDPLASPNSWHVAPSAPVRVLRLVIHPPQHEQLEQAPAGHAGVIGLVPSLALDS
jgi:hypothetical protein